jgi:hypothetical protein
MDDDIAPLLPVDQMPAIRTQHHLFTYWRSLMGELGFSERLLWCAFLDAGGYPTPVLSQIADVPSYPDDQSLGNLMGMFARVLDDSVPGGSVAVLLSRPGSAYVTDSDLAWGRGLTFAAERARVPMRPVHLANDEEVRVFAYDDLLLPRSAS